MDFTRRKLSIATLSGAALAVAGIRPANATVEQLNHDSYAALHRLYAEAPHTRLIAARSSGILIFPRIIKAGVLVGGQSGDGTLFVGKHVQAHYNISGASVGLQVGAQAFSYVLFFIDQTSLDYLETSSGWSLGSGPSVVALDQSKTASWTAAGAPAGDVYGITFGATGLMATLSLEGTKITRIHPSA